MNVGNGERRTRLLTRIMHPTLNTSAMFSTSFCNESLVGVCASLGHRYGAPRLEPLISLIALGPCSASTRQSQVRSC